MNHASVLRAVCGIGAAVVLTSLFSTKVQAQDLDNGASGKICNNATGTIRLKSPSGEFKNANATIADIINDGKFELIGANNLFTGTQPLGSSATFRVPGKVDYAASTGTQNVQARWYTTLEMDAASSKAIPDATYVSSVYNVTGTSGNRTYTGTFHYDGSLAQTVFPENGGSSGTNRYRNLELDNSTKTIAEGANVILDGTFANLNDAPLTLNGQLYLGTSATSDAPITLNYTTTPAELRTGTGAANYNANVTVTKGNINSPGGAGDVTIGNTATLSLANDANATVTFGNATKLFVTGTFTNSFAASTNLNFDCGSTVTYNGAGSQTVVPTVATNPYGDLATLNSGKIAGGDVNLCGAISVSGGNLAMNSGGNYRLTMLNVTKSATYAGGAEVVGQMRRQGSVANPLATGSAYTFNNTNTIVTFTAGTFASTDYMGFDDRPATNPNSYDNTKDVNRKLTIDYSANSTWAATIRGGYQVSDIPGTWGPTVNENNLRFFEAPPVEKVATGSVYTRDQSGIIHYIQLAAIKPTGFAGAASREIVASGNDLLMRGGPTDFTTIANGRWSNPATWDEGVEPGPLDNAIVAHTVHVGYIRTGIDNYTTNESSPSALAANVTINNIAGASLLFGSGTGAGYLSGPYSLPIGGTLTNNRQAAACALVTTGDLTTSYSSSALFDGLLNFEGVTVHTNTLINNGTISNGGVVEVGD